MFRNVFLVDMTEHRGLEQSALRSVQAYASECNPELVDWFKLHRQVQPELATAGKVFSGLETGPQLWPQIRQRIVELSSNGYSGSVFHVISYDPYILSEARALNRPDVVVRTTPLAVLLTKYRALGAPSHYGVPRQFPSSSAPAEVTLPEWLDLTKRILRQYGHTSPQKAILVVQLRPLLVRHDRRAKRNPMDRNSGRLISNIIAEGIRTDCIRRFDAEGIPGTERIWLSEVAERTPDPGSVSTTTAGAQQPHLVPPPEIGASGADSTAIHEAIQRLPASPDSDQQMSERPDALTPKLRAVPDKGRVRTRAIEGVLGADGAKVYSPKAQRDKLFKALRACLPKGGCAKTLLQLTREIRLQAGAEESDGFPFWHPAAQGFVGMLLGAGVLRDELGKNVPPGLFAKSARILSFDEPLEDLCEAFLLETAIKDLGDVTDKDRVSLAHALFWDQGHSDRDKVEERFEHVLRLLDGRLTLCDNGKWVIGSCAGSDERESSGAA